MARRFRKHRTALIALAVYNFVFFFPVAFMGRVVSPNDVFTNFSPWNMGRPLDVTRAQNSLLNDPPTAYYTLLALAKQEPGTFHWNPYIASGVPGYGSAAAATLTPFALLPLLVPLTWLYTAMAFLKLNASFIFAYLWLREERLGRRGAAIGAILFAGAGMYSVRWLWHITNTTALYPALLWIVRRTFNGKRTPILVITFIAVSFAISGFPATIAYGAWVSVLYSLFLGVRRLSRRFPIKGFAHVALGVLIAALIALPTLIPFIQLIGRSGYLDMRQTMSVNAVYPLHHTMSFLQPDRLGNPAYKNWTGDPKLGVLDNYVEASIYLGLLAFPLALFGLFSRRARAKWFWLAAALLILACMFNAPGIATFLSKVPGFKYSALARLGLILPLPIAYLAASARLRKELIYGAVAILVAFDLAVFAGKFHPYLTHEQASVAITPTIEFLQSDKRPFRVAPMMDYLWPNSAELVRVEDVRSHFSSEADYRKMLQRLELGSWSGRSTVITFFSPNFKFDDPLTGLLGIRWFIEHKYIDILKWGIFKATVPGVKETGTIALKPGMTLTREVRVDAEPFWSIELPANIEKGDGRLEVTLLKNGAPVWSRAFTKDEANVMSKIYVPLRPYARLGETVTLRVHARGVRGYVLEAENKQSVFYGRVTTPLYFERELPEGRVFGNLAELPRFRAVSRLRKLNDDEFLAARDVNFETEAVITDDPVQPPALTPTNARVSLTHYTPSEQRITTTSDAPFYLASSEKLTPELAITIDGNPARAIETDMIFAGVEVPAGQHEVVFSRRIGRGWWWTAWVGVGLLVIAVAMEITSSRRRGSPDTRTARAMRA